MDAYLTSELLRALGEGDIKKFVAYLAIFLVIWMEVRGVKNQLKTLNTNVSNSFAAGEKRFDTIEHSILDHEHRLLALEHKGVIA